MLTELNHTLKALRAAYAFIRAQKDRVEETDRAFDAAIDAVFLACARTRTYLAQFEDDLRALDAPARALPSRATERLVAEAQRFRDLEREEQLSDLWWETAGRIAAFDADLADRLMIKSYCWADPRLFTTRRYSGIRLNLDDIFDETRAMVRRRRDPDALAGGAARAV